MPSDPLTSRERVLLALDHQPTDRIPIAMVCSGINQAARDAFESHLAGLGHPSLSAYLDSFIDIAAVAPNYIGPKLEPGCDIWGVHRAPVSYGLGFYNEIDVYPLADVESVDQLEQHRWPGTDWFDYTVIPDRIRAADENGDKCIMIANGNIFETAWYMRGFERMFLDLATNPDLAREILERVTTFYLEHFLRILTAAPGRIHLVFTADDIGGQNGLLMSLGMWEQFIKPHHARLNALIHDHGAKVIYHTDGAVMEAVPGLVDMGIDVLQALQFDAAGMDPGDLKSQFGSSLCFQGGVSVQNTLPFGSPHDVRQEVEHLITTLGQNGGYILGPAHAIQAGTPPENIHAMFETARSFYPH